MPIGSLLVEPDDRGRVSLARLPGPQSDRYVATRLDDGSIVLQPAVSMSRQALDALLMAASRPGRQARMLDEVLAERGILPDGDVAQLRARLEARSSNEATRVRDIPEDRLAEMRAANRRRLA